MASFSGPTSSISSYIDSGVNGDIVKVTWARVTLVLARSRDRNGLV